MSRPILRIHSKKLIIRRIFLIHHFYRLLFQGRKFQIDTRNGFCYLFPHDYQQRHGADYYHSTGSGGLTRVFVTHDKPAPDKAGFFYAP
jgi:hypothetical protein